MTNYWLTKIVIATIISTSMGILTLKPMSSLAEIEPKQPMTTVQNMPNENMNHNQKMATDMQEMMTHMQEMMTKMQDMMANMTPEQRKVHEQMMSGDMHKMMMEMQKMYQMMINHNSMNH